MVPFSTVPPMGHFIGPALSLPHFTCSVVRYTLAKWIVSKNVPLKNLRPVASGIHIQCPCDVIRLHPVYIYSQGQILAIVATHCVRFLHASFQVCSTPGLLNVLPTGVAEWGIVGMAGVQVEI